MVIVLNQKRRKMKFRYISNVIAGLLLLFAAGCDPIEDRKILENSYNPDNIQLEAVQTTNGGNSLILKMNTPGVTGYWDYNIGTKYTDRVEFVYPIPGKNTFTYHVTTAYMPNGNPSETEYISKTIDVTIDVLDHPLPEQWYYLVGDELEGKTWVFDGVGGDERIWWTMVAPYNHAEVWWNAGGTCCPPLDASGSIRFDLDGAANYTYKASPDGDEVVGSYALDTNNGKLAIVDAELIGKTHNEAEPSRLNPDGIYEVIELSKDKLVLYTNTNDGGTGWKWIFKPQS